jgi:hypothetical protein
VCSSDLNSKPIELTGFPKDYVTLTLAGAASSLKGVDDINSLELTMKFGKVKMSINGSAVPLKPFPTIMLARTLIAMASTLKGVEGEVVSLEIKMQTE